MKKLLIAPTVALLVVGWIIARLTHVIDIYKVPTKANKPTIQPGDRIYASRLKEPKFGRLICFKKDPKSIYVFRCIGTPGDIIEIRDAIVYRNKKRLYEPYVWNEYAISQKQLEAIAGYVEQYHYDTRRLEDSLYYISMSATDFNRYHLQAKQFINRKGILNDVMFPAFKASGNNEDNMGPVMVPANNYFVLGDNRHNAEDSRYLGFVKKADIVSTVINR